MNITMLITKLGAILREIGGVAAAAELGQDPAPGAAAVRPACRSSRGGRPGAPADACPRNA